MSNPLERASRALLQRLKAVWPAWLLVGGVTALMGSSLAEAGWVENSAPLISALLWGLLFGALLARSRFAGWFALLYGQVMALCFGLQWLGNLLPPLNVLATRPALESAALANARLLLLTERVRGWLAALGAGESVRDTGLFVLLVGLLAWHASAWLAWAFIRRRRALQGMLPYGALLGLNVQLSNQSLWLFVVFLILALPMAARTDSNHHHADWERRRVDYPDELGWSWGGAALGLAVVIALGARLAVFAATPEGWNALAEALRPVRETVEDTTARWFADVNPPRYQPTESVTPVPRAQTPQMGTVGAAPAQGSALVMWVSTDGPIPPPPDLEERGIVANAVPIRYWRSEIYAQYSGAGWLPPQFEPAQPAPPLADGSPLPPALEDGRTPLTQNFEILALHGDSLFAASAPRQASPGLWLRRSAPDGSPLAGGGLSKYTVRSWVTRTSQAELLAAPANYPAALAAAYLQLPSSLPGRVRDLAERLTAGAATAYEKALRIQNYLRSTYPYKLDVPPPPAGMDAVDYFLFQAPGGFCSYYASAMAVMLRSQGVPARVAVGYAMGVYNAERQAYAVTVSDAHAWVEVYFAGPGWVEFEPTAGLAAIEYEKGGAAGPAPMPPLPEPPTPPAPFPWTGVGIGAVFLAALGTLVYFALRRPSPAPSPAGEVEQLYRQMRARLGWARLRAPASATPAEFSARAREQLPQGRLSAAVEQVTAVYEQAIYSPRPPGPHQAARAQHAWQQARWEWLKAWARAALRMRDKP